MVRFVNRSSGPATGWLVLVGVWLGILFLLSNGLVG